MFLKSANRVADSPSQEKSSVASLAYSFLYASGFAEFLQIGLSEFGAI